jgi:hypothetical protein
MGKGKVLDLSMGWNGGQGAVKTYGNFARHEINLVEDEDEMLVRRFFPNILLDRPTTRTNRIACVKNME